MNRRRFLGLTGGALGCAVLPAMQAPPRRVKGVIWLWMDGGMPQVHTWDPKPGSGTREIGTALEGIQLSELLPRCASQAQHLTIVRSLSHGAADHDFAARAVHVGDVAAMQRDVPPIGTILAVELAQKDHPLPKFITIGPQPVPASEHFPEEYRPFLVNSANNPVPNLRRIVARDRDDERAKLLLEQSREWNATRQQAEVRRVESGMVVAGVLMNTPLLAAFNLLNEPLKLRQDYGEGFGTNCLMARRLIEAGCPFVEVGLDGWGLFWKWRARELDHGLGTLVRDLAEKGLLQDVLVVCATAFGRKPGLMEPWPRGYSVVLAGGSLPGGRVYGDTGADGMTCTSPASLKSFFATIYQACGIDPATNYEWQGRKLKYLEGGTPIADLL